MELFNYFKDCIKRIFLYQFLIFFSLLRYTEKYQNSDEFLKKLRFLFRQLHLSPKILPNQMQDKEFLYLSFLILLIVISVLSILGIKFFQFICGLFCFFIAFIYYNPSNDFFLNLKEKISNDTLENNLPSINFLICICIGFAMIANCFSEKLTKDNFEKKPIKKKEEKKVEEKNKEKEEVKPKVEEKKAPEVNIEKKEEKKKKKKKKK